MYPSLHSIGSYTDIHLFRTLPRRKGLNHTKSSLVVLWGDCNTGECRRRRIKRGRKKITFLSGNAPTVRMLGGYFCVTKIILLRVVLISSFISLPLYYSAQSSYAGLVENLSLALHLLIILHHLVRYVSFPLVRNIVVITQ